MLGTMHSVDTVQFQSKTSPLLFWCFPENWQNLTFFRAALECNCLWGTYQKHLHTKGPLNPCLLSSRSFWRQTLHILLTVATETKYLQAQVEDKRCKRDVLKCVKMQESRRLTWFPPIWPMTRALRHEVHKATRGGGGGWRVKQKADPTNGLVASQWRASSYSGAACRTTNHSFSLLLEMWRGESRDEKYGQSRIFPSRQAPTFKACSI